MAKLIFDIETTALPLEQFDEAQQEYLFNRMLAPRLGLPVDEAAVTAALPRARLCLSEIARLMGDQPFLAGERISLADLMVIPLLSYFSRVPEGAAPIAEHPSLGQWMARIEGRQSFQVTKPPGV